MNRAEQVQLTPNTRIFRTDVAAYTFSTGNVVSYPFGEFCHFDNEPVMVCGVKMFPYGSGNSLPSEIRNIMEKNNLAPGILNREAGLLYGTGPALFRLNYGGGQINREYTDDREIWDWLRSWNYRRYIEMAIVEYKYMGGFFSRQYCNRGVRVGMPEIVKLEVEPNISSRLGYVETLRFEDVTKIYVGAFDSPRLYGKGITEYPVFDPQNPFKHPVSMSYHNSYSFGRNFYAMPSYYGTLPWIMRHSDIPEIIRYLTENGIAMAFHIHSPQDYWDEKTGQLKEKFPAASEDVIRQKLKDLETEIFNAMAAALSGKKNAGKFIHTVDLTDPMTGAVHTWKIEPIEQQIKDFIDAQLKVSGEAASATTSGMGLHPALSNILIQGKMASGSEMLYALKIYLASDVSIAEEIVFEALNQVIAANFPDKNLKLGFYHPVIKKEEDTSTKDRITNQQ